MPDAGTSVRKIINYGIDDKLASLEIVSIGATKEFQMQENLLAMIREWDNIVFPISNYKDTDINILSSLDDIQVNKIYSF